jgi:Flp pilus assembly protein TadB
MTNLSAAYRNRGQAIALCLASGLLFAYVLGRTLGNPWLAAAAAGGAAGAALGMRRAAERRGREALREERLWL